MIFEKLAEKMKNYTVMITSSMDEKGTMTVLVHFKINSKAELKELSPLVYTGTPAEIDQVFLDSLSRASEKVARLTTMITEFDKSEEQAKKAIEEKRLKTAKTKDDKKKASVAQTSLSMPEKEDVKEEEEDKDETPDDDGSEEARDFSNDDTPMTRNSVTASPEPKKEEPKPAVTQPTLSEEW